MSQPDLPNLPERLLSEDLALMAQKMAVHLGGAPYVTVPAGDFQWWLDFMGRATAEARRLEIRAGVALDPAQAVAVRLPESVSMRVPGFEVVPEYPEPTFIRFGGKA